MSAQSYGGGAGVPLSAGDFVQEASGTGTGSGVTATLPSGTTAGNAVLIAITLGDPGVTAPAISGFLRDASSTGTGGTCHIMRKANIGAGETTWSTGSLGGSTTYVWHAYEVSNIATAGTLDATVGTTAVAAIANGGTKTSGTTGETAALMTMQLAVFGWAGATAGSGSWSGYTNGFDEVSEAADAEATGPHCGQAVARHFTATGTGQWTTTATFAGAGTESAFSCIAAYRSADSPIVAPLLQFAGFDWGTHGGIANTTVFTEADSVVGRSTGTNFAGTWGTNYLIQAGSARASTHGLRVTTSAAICYVPMWAQPTTNTGVLSFGMNVRVVSATGTVVVAETFSSLTSTVSWQIIYDATNTQFGIRTGTAGTPIWQSGTTALNTWVWLDAASVSGGGIAWRIETAANTYTLQTSSGTGSGWHVLRLGGNVSQTMTADYDDLVMSKTVGAFPLGPHQIRVLTVDPAGTPTVSGTTTNFSVFTANGTLAAWNATNARNAVDEVPPTVSASADGVVQTAAATDYMEFPMADYTLAATEYVAGVRVVCPMWGGTGAGTGTLGISVNDGTTTVALIPATTSYDAGSPTAVSDIDPLWLTKLWTSTGGWTQAKLNAAVVRVGFSSDATPDMGVSAIYLEVAIGKTKTQANLIGDYTSAELDPTRQGLMSVTVTPPASTGLTLRWTDKNGSGTQYTAALGTFTQQFDSASAADVTVIEVESDPELPGRE